MVVFYYPKVFFLPLLISSPRPVHQKFPSAARGVSVCRGVPDAVERNAYPGLERCNRITTAPVLEDIRRGSRTPVANAHTARAKSVPSTSFSPGSTQEPVSPDLTSFSLYAVPLGTQSSLCFQQSYYAYISLWDGDMQPGEGGGVRLGGLILRTVWDLRRHISPYFMLHISGS